MYFLVFLLPSVLATLDISLSHGSHDGQEHCIYDLSGLECPEVSVLLTPPNDMKDLELVQVSPEWSASTSLRALNPLFGTEVLNTVVLEAVNTSTLHVEMKGTPLYYGTAKHSVEVFCEGEKIGDNWHDGTFDIYTTLGIFAFVCWVVVLSCVMVRLIQMGNLTRLISGNAIPTDATPLPEEQEIELEPRHVI